VRLYHFTCSHGAAGIAASGVVKPLVAWAALDALGYDTGLADAPAVWWATPLATPRREDVGLTSKMLTCDRMEHCFVLDEPPDAMPWLLFAAMHHAHPAWLRSLSGRVDQWWVGTSAVPVA